MYEAAPDAASVLAVVAPGVAYDLLTAGGMILACGALLALLPEGQGADKT